jgi:hypothetical protein
LEPALSPWPAPLAASVEPISRTPVADANGAFANVRSVTNRLWRTIAEPVEAEPDGVTATSISTETRRSKPCCAWTSRASDGPCALRVDATNAALTSTANRQRCAPPSAPIGSAEHASNAPDGGGSAGTGIESASGPLLRTSSCTYESSLAVAAVKASAAYARAIR